MMTLRDETLSLVNSAVGAQFLRRRRAVPFRPSTSRQNYARSRSGSLVLAVVFDGNRYGGGSSKARGPNCKRIDNPKEDRHDTTPISSRTWKRPGRTAVPSTTAPSFAIRIGGNKESAVIEDEPARVARAIFRPAHWPHRNGRPSRPKPRASAGKIPVLPCRLPLWRERHIQPLVAGSSRYRWALPPPPW